MDKVVYNKEIESLGNPSFGEIRRIACASIACLSEEERTMLWNQLNRGVDLLYSHELMCQYLWSFGINHEIRMHKAFEALYKDKDAFKENFAIVDWGCGQGLATVCFFDFLKQKNIQNKTQKVVLIEPSPVTLERAIFHVNAYLKDENKIQPVHKYLDDVSKDDIFTNQHVTFHFFSNILDIPQINLKKLAQLLGQNVIGEHYFCCVSPLYEESQRIDKFFEYFSLPIVLDSREEREPNNIPLKLKVFKFERDKVYYFPVKYIIISDFVDGKAKAKRENFTLLSGNYGYVDKQGNIIIPFEYDGIGEFINGKAKAVKGHHFKRYGFIDENGNIIIPFEYSEIGEFVNGVAKAKKEIRKWSQIGGSIDKKWGFIDEQGNAIIPFEYDEIGEFINGKAKAVKGHHFKRYGFIDESGNIIIPFEYSEIGEFINGKAKAKKTSYIINNRQEKWGYIDEQGNIVIPFEYEEVGEFIEGKTRAKKYSNFGYIDEYGYELIENKIKLENGLIKGKKFGKWGIETKEKITVVPFEYDMIDTFIDGIAKISKTFSSNKREKWAIVKVTNNYFGIIDERGSIIIPCKYDAIAMMKNYFVVIKSNLIKKIIHSGLNAQTVICSIENIVNFGVFVKSGNINGLLHISEIKSAGKEISDFSKDDTLELFILAVDEDKSKISFSFSPNGKERKFSNKENLYNKDSLHMGKITRKEQYGLFVRLCSGKNALLHISELKKLKKSYNDFNIGDLINVKIINIDERNRISVTIDNSEKDMDLNIDFYELCLHEGTDYYGDICRLNKNEFNNWITKNLQKLGTINSFDEVVPDDAFFKKIVNSDYEHLSQQCHYSAKVLTLLDDNYRYFTYIPL